MDRRSGMWSRDHSEKNLGESESSGSISSYSERYSDEQEVFGSSPTEISINHTHSPKVPSINEDNEEHGTVKILTERLSAALLDVAAKEDLIKQHAKVTEEAISGWETAEGELGTLKQQLETCSLKNSVLEDRISHLDEALKECVRQLRQSREEQEEKAQEALFKTNELESKKADLEKQIKVLCAQLETAIAEASTADKSIGTKIEFLENENLYLKTELLAQSEQLRICALERELSTQAAESASKQHLESIKKLAKLDSECRRLQAAACRTTSTRSQRTVSGTMTMEYLAENRSEDNTLAPNACNDKEKSNSWASVFIAQLDQFKQEKACTSYATASTEIDLMDDFLEMERLAATPETDHEIFSKNINNDLNGDFSSNKSPSSELETLQQHVADLEKKVKEIENDKFQLNMTLAETKTQLEASCSKLASASDKLANLQAKLSMAIESKENAMAETLALELERKELESQVETAHWEVASLCEQVELLQGKLDDKTLLIELEENIENLEATSKQLQSQLNSANGQAEMLREHVSFLEAKLEEERALSGMYLTKAEVNEAMWKKLELQLISANSDLENYNKSVAALELELKDKKSISTKLADRAETAESARSSLESQLELTNAELGSLRNEVRHLLEEIKKERALSTEYSAKCQTLEEELSKRKKEVELGRTTSSIGVANLNKEKELAEAAGKLAECQKTIASLGQQLKCLTNIDKLMFEAKIPEKEGCLPAYLFFPENDRALHSHCSAEDADFPALSSGSREWGAPASSSPASSLSGLVRLLSE